MPAKAPRLLLLCLSLTLLLSVCPQNLNAQVLYGSVVGTVTDQSGAVVPGAKVSITNRGTGQTREATTDTAGRYSIVDVLEGAYDVAVTASGFKPFTQTNLSVTINTVSRADVQMQVGAMTQEVTVAATVAPLETTKTDVHTQLGTKAITNLPLARYRNYQSLINLVPGATPGRFQNAVTDTPERALETNVNGTNRNNNNTRLDGSADIMIWLPHHAVYIAPSETVQEVNISTNNFDAEQGLAGGAAVTVATKTGTNELHGSLFAYHDNQHLRARNFFLRSPQRPKSITNIDGFTLGGPIRKNKLFFFGGFETTRERGGRNSLFSVPTADIRTGNFSAISTTIYDPNTGNPDGTGRTPFPGNTIPPVRISPIIRKLVDLTPPTNQSGPNNNFFNSATQVLNRDNYDVKINWNRSEKHTVWGKYSAMNATVIGKFGLGAGVGGPCLCDGGNGTGHTLVQLATLGHTLTLSPTFIVDGTIGWTRFGQNVVGPDFGQNFGLDVLGIPGTNGPDPRQSGMPIFTITGYTTLGNSDGWSPIFRNDQSYTYTTNATKVRGAHEVRFGFDAVHHHLNHWQPELGSGPRGRFVFRGEATALNGGPSADRFNAYAQFLLGLPSDLGKSVQFIKMDGKEWQFAWHVGDRWHVTPKLTATLGLRYEYYPLMTRSGPGGGIERYDPATNLVFLGGRGNVPKNVGVTTSKKLFAPRIGLAYRLNDATVIRTGYGITYDPMPLSRPLRGFFPLTIGSDFSGSGFTPSPLGSIANGIPSICCPDLSTGVVPLPPQALMRTPYLGQLNRGYIQSWNFIVERKLPSDFVVSVGYVGTQTVHQFADINFNAARPGGGNPSRPQFATFGRTTDTLLWQGWLSANYHSLQTTVNRQFKNGLFVKGAYTYSRAINWTDDDGWAGLTFNDPSTLRRNRAQAGYNIPHIFQLSYVYELPLGRGKRWASNKGVPKAVLGGWQVNGIFAAFQGRPFTVTANGASLNAPGSTQTADQVKPVVNKLGGIFDSPYFDTTAFAPPTGPARFGTSGRNALRGPGVVNLDLSLFRKFQLTERFQLEFRAESFNFTNTAHFNNPSGNASDAATFMKITSTDANLPERQFRFGLRLAF